MNPIDIIIQEKNKELNVNIISTKSLIEDLIVEFPNMEEQLEPILSRVKISIYNMEEIENLKILKSMR
ncbi:MAG: hypothetical protein ACRC57_00475 [Sarcina sp.]